MKRKHQETATLSRHTLTYRPDRVRGLMRAIKGELDAFQGRVIPYQDLAFYAGQATSSVFDKLQRTSQPQVEALLGWLERLPETCRNRVLNSACRMYPTLGSHRLAHDPTQVSYLRMLVRQQNGLTVLQGGDAGMRTFLVTALGHARGLLRPETRDVAGIDVHEPDWFVPVDGVFYLNNLLDAATVRERVHTYWPTVTKIEHGLVVLNGVWASFQGLEAEVVELSSRLHVVIADDYRHKFQALPLTASSPARVLSISEEKEHRVSDRTAEIGESRIRVTVQQHPRTP